MRLLAVIKSIAKFIVLFFGLSKRPEGLENLPKDKGFIIVCNHKSNWDPVKIGALFPGYVRFLAKKELFKIILLGWLLPRVGVIPLDRGRADVGAIRAAEKVLENGDVLVIFPQGTRKKTFKIEDGKRGAERLAEKMGVPVVPVGIKGRRIIIGKPIEMPTTEEIMSKIGELI